PVMATSNPVRDGGFGTMAADLITQMEAIQAKLKEEAEKYLESVAAGLRARDFQVTTCVRVEDQPATAVLAKAGSADVDLIAIETHGRHGFARLLLGSVADKVIRGTTLPVLVSRPVLH